MGRGWVHGHEVGGARHGGSGSGLREGAGVGIGSILYWQRGIAVLDEICSIDLVVDGEVKSEVSKRVGGDAEGE